MADPTANVQRDLIPHLHLTVCQTIPSQHNQISIDGALEQLIRAPQLVRNRPVSWNYWHTPSDGSVYMVWQPRQLGDNFASDGYVWTKSERLNTHQSHNYTVQTFVAEAGYIPGSEVTTSHRRVRYRILQSPNNQHDPQLELVHYNVAQPAHRFPANTIPLTKPIQDSIRERLYLEKSGQLLRKEFMLFDKSNYPIIQTPSHPVPGNPYQPGPYGRSGVSVPRGQPQMTPSRAGPAGPSGPSPNKRPNTGGQRGPGGVMQNPFVMGIKPPVPEFLQDEDSHLYGDALDHLTQKEISATRYKQHHEWMDEILMSPYATNQIIPPVLGLKLPGDLAPLTDGLWEDGKDRDDGGINPENVKEFEKRVKEYISKEEQKLADMDKAHEASMAEFRKPSIWDLLERDLARNGDSNGVEAVMKKCEVQTGMTSKQGDHMLPVLKGGLLEKGEENNFAISDPVQPQDDFSDFIMDENTAGEALDAFISYDGPDEMIM